jgi:CHAD domain-containing protein
MPYRFKAKESVADNVRRIVREEIDAALARLAHASPARRDEAVHEARKSIKKIRGVLRLVAPQLGKTFRRENTRFRDIGRQLSVLRDAAALIETVDRIERRGGHALTETVIAPVRTGLEQEKRDIEQHFTRSKTIGHAASALRSAAKRLRRWPLQQDGFKAIAPGLKRTYRAGRRALKLARREGEPVLYHDLRKRVKDHWYQIRLLESVWTGVMQAHEASLKELQEWLGEDHNLTVLREKLQQDQERFGGQDHVRAFLAVAGELQTELREKSVSLAERVYAEKPRIFVDNLGALWEAWQKQPSGIKKVEPQRRKAAGQARPGPRKHSAA